MKENSRVLNLWSKLNDMRMERKLLLVFLILITLPLSFIGYISYSSYANSIEKTTMMYSAKMLDSLMKRVDDYLEDMIRISSIPAYQDDIKQNLIRSNRYYEQRRQASGNPNSTLTTDFDLLLSIQRGIDDNISFINSIKRGANSVYIFDEYGNGYYTMQSGGIRMNIAESYQLWKQRVNQSSGEAILLSTQKYKTNLNTEKYAFTIVRKIIDKSLRPIGLIAVDAHVRVIQDQMKEMDVVTKGKSVLIDEKGNVIYDSDEQLLATNIARTPIATRATGGSGSFYFEENGVHNLIIYTTSPNTSWKFITSIPVSELTRDSIMTRNVTWIATFITIAMALLISIFFSAALTNPLRKLIRLMKNVQDGDFNVQFPVTRRDEIGLLGNQFNRMIVRIDQLIQDIYVMETKKKESELQALQNQINPHFMYNTLESIRMAAELNDDLDVADMIVILGKLLRYSISDIHENVTIQHEIKHVTNYIKLLNYRYPNRFVLHMDVQDKYLFRDYPIIKLVLQPIVENAIYHGLDDHKEQMIVHIGMRQDTSALYIEVQDDGLGMELQVLEQLNLSLQGTAVRAKNGSGGIGLKNVHDRLRLYYGAPYGLTVNSKLGGGTTVIIRLPVCHNHDSIEEGEQ